MKDFSQMRVKIALAALAALLVSSCSNIVVKPDEYRTMAPPAVIKAPLRVALDIRPDFSGYRYVGSPNTWNGSAFTFEFYLGSPTTTALTSQLSNIFTLVPVGSGADVTIRPSFEGFRFMIDDDNQAIRQGFLGIVGAAASTPAALTEMGLRLDAFDKDGKPLESVRSVGRGAARGGSALAFSMEREFTTASSYALSDAAARAVQQLVNSAAVQAKLKAAMTSR